jgi:hypothetical protein
MTIVDPSAVSIGLDPAIVAAHQVAIRGPGIREDFKVAPTLAGLARLSERLSPFAGSMVVVEPTGGTWLALGHAVENSGCRLALVKNTDSARLRTAIAGASKTDRDRRRDAGPVSGGAWSQADRHAVAGGVGSSSDSAAPT